MTLRETATEDGVAIGNCSGHELGQDPGSVPWGHLDSFNSIQFSITNLLLLRPRVLSEAFPERRLEAGEGQQRDRHSHDRATSSQRLDRAASSCELCSLRRPPAEWGDLFVPHPPTLSPSTGFGGKEATLLALEELCISGENDFRSPSNTNLRIWAKSLQKKKHLQIRTRDGRPAPPRTVGKGRFPAPPALQK